LEQCQTDYIYQIITMVTYIIQSDLKLYQVDPICQMITSSNDNIISDHIRWLPLSKDYSLKNIFLYLEEMLSFPPTIL
jgi:hypothetical protein